MENWQFDALAKQLAQTRLSRITVLRGVVAVLTTGVLTGHQESLAQVTPRLWHCPNGVDGPRLDCLCVCKDYGHSAADCQRACMACKWHVLPVCPNPDQSGEPVGPPVCCADGRHCHFVCGDCPDCEVFPDVL